MYLLLTYFFPDSESSILLWYGGTH